MLTDFLFTRRTNFEIFYLISMFFAEYKSYVHTKALLITQKFVSQLFTLRNQNNIVLITSMNFFFRNQQEAKKKITII